MLAGTANDVAWMDDTLLPLWPQNPGFGSGDDPMHAVLVHRAETPAKGARWGPPPSPAWLERATDRAAQVARREEMQTKAARFLLALGTQRATDLALDIMLERWPDKDPYESYAMVDASKRASPVWKARASGKANACFDAFAAKASALPQYSYLPDDERWRASYCIQLMVALDGATMPCERWREIERMAQHAQGLYGKGDPPERCLLDAGGG